MGAVPQGEAGPGTDGCAQLRASVATLCDRSREAQAAHQAAIEHSRELRRRLVAAEHHQEAAQAAADPRRRAEEKSAARAVYERARELAASDGQRTEAIAEWARALDRINRSSRLAKRSVSKARAEVARATDLLREAERSEQAARIGAQSAQAECLDARVRLASCEEQAETGPAGIPSPAAPHAATGGHAVALSPVAHETPLVMEALLSGDRRVLELAAARVAEHTGLPRAEAQLQLQELIDGIVASAAGAGFLLFDDRHPFWSRLTLEESRDVVGAFARLGFEFEPAQGWQAGRAPSPADLSMALGYAGQDPRHMRYAPSAEELHALPRSIGVDARAYVAARAPDLALDHVVSILDRRAARLEPLWNEWGQVRPLLLSDLDALEGQR